MTLSDGCNQNAIGACSEAEGTNTIASGTASHAEGISTIASGTASHAEGAETIANNNTAHAEGDRTIAAGSSAHAEGFKTIASGDTGHAEGNTTIASGSASHAEGHRTIASIDTAHAEGNSTIASGFASHAEGGTLDIIVLPGPQATGDFAHAEGASTMARGVASHAEGSVTIASNTAAHAEGSLTMASGIASHAEGSETVANGDNSHAEGEGTTTAGFRNAHIMGRFGDAEEDNSWFIGNGTSSIARGLGAKWLASSGDMFVDGMFIPGGADYAEMFETSDGNPIDAGYLVTSVKGGKVRKATEHDSYILGVTSASSSVLGNSAALHWHRKYATDEWGRKQYQVVTIAAVTDSSGKIIRPESKEKQPILNPNWDPRLAYVPRHERPEWVAIGLIGQVLVRDDGTCEEERYCWSNHDGVATASFQGYRVLKRVGPNQIVILIK